MIMCAGQRRLMIWGHGKDRVIYRSVQEPLNEDGTQHLFASDVQIGEEGRYYLFYCLHRSPTVSVAVCDEQQGNINFMDISVMWMEFYMDKNREMYLILIREY